MDLANLITPLVISRALSYSVITLSFCMKFPQISAILSSKSSKGVNVRGYWMEVGRSNIVIVNAVLCFPIFEWLFIKLCITIHITSYLIGSSYGYFHGFPVSTYGEAILLAIQSMCCHSKVLAIMHCL